MQYCNCVYAFGIRALGRPAKFAFKEIHRLGCIFSVGATAIAPEIEILGRNSAASRLIRLCGSRRETVLQFAARRSSVYRGHAVLAGTIDRITAGTGAFAWVSARLRVARMHADRYRKGNIILGWIAHICYGAQRTRRTACGFAALARTIRPTAMVATLLLIGAAAWPAAAAEMTREDVLAVLRAAAGEPADLSERDLSGLNLSGMDLRRVNLRGANLKGADLSAADLSDSNLDTAILRGADLQDAKLRNVSAFATVFAQADLRGSDLSGALLVCNLEYAKLDGANLTAARMGADMRNQPMGLMRVSLRKASLRGANLDGADLSRGMLEFADFSGASLRRANLLRSDAGGANFSAADLTDANFTQTDIQSAKFPGIKGRETIIGLDTALNRGAAIFD